MNTAQTSAWTDTRETRAFAFEYKFFVARDVAIQIRAWARAHLSADPHGSGPEGDEYRVTSLYLDTENLDVLHRRGSFGRAKFRIRRYGRSSVAFLERKMRTRKLLVKRRTSIAVADLAQMDDELLEARAGHWFNRRTRLRQLRTVCQVSYNRLARVSASPYGTVRLTLDHDLHAHWTDGLAFIDERGSPVIDHGMILELKYRVALPAIFKRLVEEFNLRPARRSKYRLAMAALGAMNADGRLSSRSFGPMTPLTVR